MTGRQRIGWWTSLVSIGLIGGCGGLPTRNTDSIHSTSSLLDSGPTAKVSPEQTADVQFAIGRQHDQADRLDQAEAAYRSALKLSPKRADIEARLAIVLDRKGVLKEADIHFEKALKLDPKNADLLCDRGYCFYLRGKQAEAEQALRSALAFAPKHPRSHTNLGLVLATRGDADAAVTEFNRAGTDPADSRSNLALALALDGRMEAARDQYAQALAANPGSKSATQGLKVASTVLKRGSAPAQDLPRLPGDPDRALVASNPSAPAAPRTDPAVIATALTR